MSGATLIRLLGAGNLLRSDDGFGIHVLRGLEALDWPAEVELIDVGAGGLDVVHLLSEATHVCLIDAMCLGGTPGTLYHFAREAVRFRDAAAQVSMHGFGLATALELGERLGMRPELYVVGVEPESLELSDSLTPTAQAQVVPAIEIIHHRVSVWLRK